MIARCTRAAALLFCGALSLTIGLMLGGAAATAADPFYKGKRLTVLINYAAGGPTDIEGRLFAKHLTRYIDGSPTVIVQNMDGAGGMIGNNYLGQVAPKDGTMIGYMSGFAWNAASESKRFQVDAKSFEFVAYQPGTSVYFVRRDLAPGMNDATDIAKARGLVVGGLGVTNAKDLLLRLALDMLGVEHRYVTGYQGSAAARRALEQGEIHFYSESPPSYRGVIEPALVKTGVLIPTHYDPGYNGESFRVPRQVADLDILPFHELYRKIKGTLPSGPLWDVYLSILTVNSAMQRIIALPPGAPAEAVDALRAAILKLNADKTYEAEALKAIGFAPEYEAGPETTTQVRQALTTRPEIQAFIEGYIKKAR